MRRGRSAGADGGLIQAIDDDLAPGIAVARIGVRNAAAAAKPGTVEIGTGPVDAHRSAIGEFVDVGDPGQFLPALSKRRVELKTDEIRGRRLEHKAAKIFVRRQKRVRYRARLDKLRRVRWRDAGPDDSLGASLGLQPGKQEQVARAVRPLHSANEGHADDAGQPETFGVLPEQAEVHPRGAIDGEPVWQKARQRTGYATGCRDCRNSFR